MIDLKAAALKYADNGWHVFPLHGIINGRCDCMTNCGSPGKHPRTPRGHLDASDRPEDIERWWTKWPTANIGVATGKRSSIYVVDVDNKRSVDLGNGELIGEGEHSLRVQMTSLGSSLPDTLTSQTGSGGLHLVFGYPTTDDPETTFSNRAGILSSVDTRGDGGYIVAPPSLHKSGNRYQWIDQGVTPAAIPGPWLSILTGPTKSDLALDLEVPTDWRIRENEGRHEWLFKMGAKLRGQHGLPYVALFGALSAYNGRHCDPPLKSGDVEHIVKSCMKYEPGMPHAPVIDDLDDTELEEGLDLAIPFAQFMDEEPPPFKHLVSKLLHSGELMVLGGQPNIGKTWAVMDMMMGIASGDTFANHFHCHPGPVLFIDEEGSRRGDWQRFRMLLSGRERSALDYPIYSKIDSGIKIDADRGVVAISRLIERYRPAAVFLDSLVRLHGRDESNNREMANFFAVVKRLMVNYDTSFIFTHHVPKPPSQGNQNPLWMLRGAGDIQGMPDSVLIFLPGADTSEIEVVHTKMRNDEKQPQFVLKLWIDKDEGTARIGYQPFDPLSKTNQNRNEIYAALRDAASPVSADILAALTGLSQTAVKGHLKALEAIGSVTSAKSGADTYYQTIMTGGG